MGEPLTAPSPLELAEIAVERERASQKPEELALLIEWLQDRPAFGTVVEVGCYRGGTLWLWRKLWPNARIVAIDNMSLERCPGCQRREAHRDCSNERISRALGETGVLLELDSQASATRELVAAELGGAIEFLHIDGDHSYAGVRRDWQLYSEPVAPGGVIVLHDVAGEAFPGVVSLWDEVARAEPRAFLIHEGRPDWGGIGVVPR